MSNFALDVLPLELWLEIAKQSSNAWHGITTAIVYVGRYSLDPEVQHRMMDRFVDDNGFLPNGAKHGKHVIDAWPKSQYGRIMQEWYLNGKLHRNVDDQPASIWFRHGGTLALEEWWQHGKLHRIGDPAVKDYDEDGILQAASWHQRNNNNRPVTLFYCKDGTLEPTWREIWYREHRAPQ